MDRSNLPKLGRDPWHIDRTNERIAYFANDELCLRRSTIWEAMRATVWQPAAAAAIGKASYLNNDLIL
jgi:hypothetical protein